MNAFTAPIPHSWFTQNSIVATPDNGLLYFSLHCIVYIPPVVPNCLPNTRIINTPDGIKAFACAPDWSEKRLFATLHNKQVYVWDLDLEQPINGHRGHTTNNAKQSKKGPNVEVSAAMCFSKHGKLISCNDSDLIVYCLLTDTYKVSPEFFRKKSVVALQPSPVDNDVFIAGLNDGLLIMFSIKKMTILHSMRGHDREIVSIDCMSVPVLKRTGWRSKGKGNANTNVAATGSGKKEDVKRPVKKARKKACAPEADSSDFLNIYDFNESQEEFGTIIDHKSKDDSHDRIREKTKTVEGFNFLEACENLKEDILKAANRRDDDESDEDAENLEQSGINQEAFNTDDENDLDDCEKLRDYIVVNNEDEHDPDTVDESLTEAFVEQERKLILVTGSREKAIWFWDYETGLPIDKVYVPSDASARLCNTIFTNAVWLDESRVVANTSAGHVIDWKVEITHNDSGLHLTAEMGLVPYPVEKIFHVIRAKGVRKTDSNGRYLWCSSLNRKLICLEVTESGIPNEVVNYGCIIPSNRYILENPLESMVIALACSAPRIETINLANLHHDNISFKSITYKIGCEVMVLDWHPEEEEKLAFATKEGRIGVVNTRSPTNVPILLKSFTNKEVYALKWCYLTDEKQQRRLVLFASGKTVLVYYHFSGVQKYEPIKCLQFGHVSNISVANNLCFIGTQDGTVFINDLDHNLSQIYKGKIAKRYISALEYKQSYLAVGSNENSIRVINFSDGFDDIIEREIIVLEGHTDGICDFRWNRGESMRLVSCSFDGSVRVWDALLGTCLKIYQSRIFTFSAIFSPLDDNIILFVGKGSSLCSFDYTKDHVEPPKEPNTKIKFAVEEEKRSKAHDVNKKKQLCPSASSNRNTILETPDNVNVECSPEAIYHLAEKVKKVSLNETNGPHSFASLSTTFPLTHRETNKIKDVLQCIVKLLHTVEPEPEPIELEGAEHASDDESLDGKSNADPKSNAVESGQLLKLAPSAEPSNRGFQEDDEKLFYNEKLFSTEEKLKQLIEEEANLQIFTDTSSIGLIVLPQLLHKLKETLLRNVSKRKLTPQMLALAPYVSHTFWRQCCQAYAYQLIENGQSLAAVPYLLASHKVDATIEELCEAKYFREAWVICRLQKMPDDPVLEKVASQWASYLDGVGNFEAAALVWTGVKKYEKAISALSKRLEITDDIQRAIGELTIKLQETCSEKQT
ncbi:protein rigor mortis [Anopheles nili]|uniref:protein rigor mortis n=1 Tax=Anopheles nili TaxID=185578 RepID=UPI00237B96A2|nr:protein rigor mortis [Anopheles nili]